MLFSCQSSVYFEVTGGVREPHREHKLENVEMHEVVNINYYYPYKAPYMKGVMLEDCVQSDMLISRNPTPTFLRCSHASLTRHVFCPCANTRTNTKSTQNN